MLKKILNEVSKFDLYFREAEEDEGGNVEVKVAPRANRGTDYSDETTKVNAAPRNNRGTDYTEDDDTANDTETNTDNNDTENQPDDNTEDNAEDYTDDEDNTDDTGNDDNTDDTSNEDNADDTGNEPDTGEAEDYTDDSSDDTQQDNTSDNQTDDTPTPSADDRKKYNLYLRFLKLIDMIDSFTDKLRNIVKDDPVQNAVLSKVVDNLTELHDTMYEYMTVKFITAKYVEALIYFETIISVVKLNFELIRNNKINLKQ